MKQIVDKLNKIAKKIDESVEIPQTDLIIDSLDAITKAYGGTPNDSNLIVDKLEDIYNNIEPAVSGNIEITENGENINVAPYATATVNVSGGGGDVWYGELTITNNGLPRQIELTTYNDSGLVPFLRLIKPTITNSDTLKVSIAPGDSKLVSTLITIYKLESELSIPLSAASGTTITPYAPVYDNDHNIIAFVYKITSTGATAAITINSD